MSWRAEGALQGMGRTHRTGQVSAPIYVFCSTTIPGEKRFSSTPARRIAALGALSRGQREAADNGLFRAEDNLETSYAHAALRVLLDDIAAGRTEDISREQFYLQTGIDAADDELRAGRAPVGGRKLPRHRYLRMTRFLNRLLACDIAADGGFQGRVMDAFVDRLEHVIDDAIARRAYDVGVETFRPDHLTVRRRESIHTDTHTGARTELLALDVTQMPSSLTTFSAAMAKVAHYEKLSGHDDAGFALEHATVRLFIPVRHRAGSLEPLVRVISADAEELRLQADLRGAPPISRATAEPLWERAVAAVKARRWVLYVIAGALTPIWDRLPPGIPTVYRMQTDDGERLLARVIADDELERLFDAFSVALPPAA